MPEKDAKRILADEIVQDADRQVERNLKRAEAEAAKIIADAKAQAAAAAEALLNDARARAARRREMILHTVAQEVARRKLRAREAILGQAFEQAGKRLQALSGEDYERSLVALACAALREMPGHEFRIEVSAPSGGPLDSERLRSKIQSALGRNPVLHVAVVKNPGSGLVIESADGKLRWNDSYAVRLRRLQPDLKSTLAPLLFEET